VIHAIKTNRPNDQKHLRSCHQLDCNDNTKATQLWRTELKKDCACVTSDPVGKAVGAKISTWATHSQWKTLKSLDFAVKFQSVFRYETVVFRRHVLALLLVALLWKFEAYLFYISLIWGKFPRRFLCFQKFRHFSYMFSGFLARISDMRNHFSALSCHISFVCHIGQLILIVLIFICRFA